MVMLHIHDDNVVVVMSFCVAMHDGNVAYIHDDNVVVVMSCCVAMHDDNVVYS